MTQAHSHLNACISMTKESSQTLNLEMTEWSWQIGSAPTCLKHLEGAWLITWFRVLHLWTDSFRTMWTAPQELLHICTRHPQHLPAPDAPSCMRVDSSHTLCFPTWHCTREMCTRISSLMWVILSQGTEVQGQLLIGPIPQRHNWSLLSVQIIAENRMNKTWHCRWNTAANWFPRKGIAKKDTRPCIDATNCAAWVSHSTCHGWRTAILTGHDL